VSNSSADGISWTTELLRLSLLDEFYTLAGRIFVPDFGTRVIIWLVSGLRVAPDPSRALAGIGSGV
jgi:hypothetical protein